MWWGESKEDPAKIAQMVFAAEMGQPGKSVGGQGVKREEGEDEMMKKMRMLAMRAAYLGIPPPAMPQPMPLSAPPPVSPQLQPLGRSSLLDFYLALMGGMKR